MCVNVNICMNISMCSYASMAWVCVLDRESPQHAVVMCEDWKVIPPCSSCCWGARDHAPWPRGTSGSGAKG